MHDDPNEGRLQRDVEIVAHSEVNFSMQGWAKRWMILGDGSIGCVACEGNQFADQGCQTFTHEADCRHEGVTAENPWFFLREHLDHISKTRAP